MVTRDIRVLVVDDSAVIRAMIRDNIEAAPGMEVAGIARDGKEALEVFKRVRPDVVTLDVQMPEMDGLATLGAILEAHCVPVIMVSALTQLGADTTLEALDQGALDYVAKPERGKDAEKVLRDELLRKIRNVAGTDVERVLRIRQDRKQRRLRQADERQAPKAVSDASPTELADKCIVIGISTGGPPALSTLFESLRPPMPPIVVVQHMPPQFTKPLAWRLDSLSSLSISEAASGDMLRPNHVLIAPGGKHLLLRRRGSLTKAVIDDGPPVSSHKPSVDVLMKSVAEIFGSRAIGVVMTGMGRDGSDGCGMIRAAGGYVLGQDEATSDVYGMNKVAQVEGNVDRQFRLNEAATVLTSQVKRMWIAGPAGVSV